MASNDPLSAPAAPTGPPTGTPDYDRASGRLGAAIGLIGYAVVAAFLTLGAALAFGATRDPTPTEFAFACEVLWLPALAAGVAAIAPGSTQRRRAITAGTIAIVAVSGWIVAAIAGKARFPGYPVVAPAEVLALRYAILGGVPGLVAVAVAAWRGSTRWGARVAAPAAWAVAVVAVAAGSGRLLDHPLRDGLPASVPFRRLEFFNRTGSSRYILRVELTPAESAAYLGRLGLVDKPGVMPAWEYPTADWWTPPRTPGARWMSVETMPHEVHCSTFATTADGTLFLQRRCDPQ